MLESYYEEIARKKRAARIFWLVVFIFAGFLFFFFQGYYPDIQFRLSSVGSGAVSGEESQRVTIRSFGIVNIKVSPENLDLRLNTLPYGNNEKKMVDYGEYTFTVSGEGYLPGNFHFTINNERPYYIDLLSILQKPHYSRFTTPVDQVAKIGENIWIIGNNSGMTLYEEGFLTGVLVSKKQFPHIGEGYFLSGTTIISYDTEEKAWKTTDNEGWSGLMEDCGNIEVKYTILSCHEKKEIALQNGKIYTGVLSIGKDYFQTSDSIFSVEGSKIKKIPSQSGSFLPKDTTIISINNDWYYSQSGSFLPVSGTGAKIVSSLSTISHAEWNDGELLIFGRKGKDTYLTFYDVNFPEKTRIIPFPDIELNAVRIWRNKGNTFIKTKNTLLCIYHGSNETLWIIDGKILTAGTDTALYEEKDGKIWRAEWGTAEKQ